MERTTTPSPLTDDQPEKLPSPTRPERYSQELTHSPYPAQLAHSPQHSSSQLGGYPPGYPPVQHYPPHYSLPQGHYKVDPPPYYSQQPPPPQRQTTTGVVVVQQQPTYTVKHVVVGDHYRTFSIIVCIVCCIFGSPFTLCCTIPAICSALQARDAQRYGDDARAASKDRATIALNVTAIIFGSIVLAFNIFDQFFLLPYEE